ncbi:hypothetical protein MTO96_051245 [Rhipicephalus appendiculatus]
MELEGLKRSLQIFEANGLIIDLLVTDRHSQIKAFAAKEGSFDHNYDCWHIGKSLRKKLTAASKLKKYSSITPWINAIINHFYWCAVSSEGQPEFILPKWRSLAAHIANEHTHDDELYPRCQHDALLNKKWLEEDYIKELLESTEDICREAGSLKEASLQASVIMPPTLSSQYDHEDKDSLIAKRRARFNRKCMWS